MWKTVENSNNLKPAEIDSVSSNDFVFVRKDFVEKPTYNKNGNQIGTHWQYLENDISKADWDIYKKAMENENAMIDTQLAICDLYEMITGGASNG